MENITKPLGYYINSDNYVVLYNGNELQFFLEGNQGKNYVSLNGIVLIDIETINISDEIEVYSIEDRIVVNKWS